MRIDITRQPLGIVLMQFFLLMLLFWSRAEFFPTPVERVDMSSGFALGGIFDFFIRSSGVLGQLIVMGVVFVNAMLITRIVTRNMVLEARTFLPALIYLMTSCGLYIGGGVSGYLVSMFTIHGTHYFIRGFRRTATFDFVFRGGLLFGLAVLFSFEAVLLFIATVIAMIIFRRTIRETIAMFAGFVLPFAIYSYIYWGMGYDFSYVALWGWRSLALFDLYGIYISAIGVPQILFVSILTLVVFLSLGAFVVNTTTMRNRAQRIFIFFIWLLLFGIVMFALPVRSSLGYSLIAAPVALIAPYYFVKHHSRTSLYLYIALIATAVGASVIPFLL